MKRSGTERVKLWHPPCHTEVALMRAAYVRQTFARHTHDDYAVGVIEQGGLGFRYRGENLVAAPGQICLVIPGETHDGHPAGESGWTYRMFYLQPSLMHRAAGQLSGKAADPPFFRPGVLSDNALAAMIVRTHRLFEDPQAGLMEKQSRLIQLLCCFIARHADPAPRMHGIGDEHQAVARARDFMETHFALDLSVVEMAAHAGLSPFHFIRVFKRHIGLSPHTYLIQVRVRRARQMLNRGSSIAQCALEAGFADQSHLTRHFKRVLGITPGQYRNSVQDRSATRC